MVGDLNKGYLTPLARCEGQLTLIQKEKKLSFEKYPGKIKAQCREKLC